MKRTELLADVDGSGLSIGLVMAEFNGFITERLLEGALAACESAGVESTTVVRVGGALELAVVAGHLAPRHDAVVAIGAIIEGDTDHYTYVAGETFAGLGRVATQTGVPVASAVLTVKSVAHAEERAALGPDNKGYEAVHAAITAARAIASLGG
jgi:6,7-dimethyl-8-ribityllumazine synthase